MAQWRDMASKILVNTGSGNGLLPDGTETIPEPSWITIHEILDIHSNVCLNTQDINPQVVFEISTFEIIATPPRGQWVNSPGLTEW